jgi:hypothetical protein
MCQDHQQGYRNRKDSVGLVVHIENDEDKDREGKTGKDRTE